jgi:hypothetical protein
MNLIIGLTGIVMVCWLMVSIFRVIAYKIEQFVEMSEKVNSTRETNQLVPTSKAAAKISKVLAHKNR